MDIPDLKGVSGGSKHIVIKQYLSLIMQYCDAFGPEETCRRFNMERDTLKRWYSRTHKEVPLTKSDRAMALAEIARESSNELAKEVRQLRKEFSEFKSSVASQVASKILVPWIESAIRLTKELEIKEEAVSETDLRDLLQEYDDGDSERE